MARVVSRPRSRLSAAAPLRSIWPGGAVNTRGETALYAAAVAGHAPIVEQLLAAGADASAEMEEPHSSAFGFGGGGPSKKRTALGAATDEAPPRGRGWLAASCSDCVHPSASGAGRASSSVIAQCCRRAKTRSLLLERI